MRQKHELSHEEFTDFNKLYPAPGAALAFWRRVAKARGLDPKSIMSNGLSFTGLPEGHGQHWCFPSPLNCAKPPPRI